MRLYDRILSQRTQDADELRGISSQTSVLCCDEIAKYYWESATEVWESDRYPYATPPWETFFAEWNVPRYVRNANGQLLPNESVLQQQGIFGITIRDAKEIAEFMKKIDDTSINVPGTLRERIEGTELVVSMQPFISTKGVAVRTPTFATAFLSSEGWVKATALRGETSLLGGGDDVEYQRAIGAMCHIVFLAFTFLNCSNVKAEEITESVQPSAKIMRRLKLPCVKRYTLNIAGHIAPANRDASDSGREGIMPFHLCRGHFATYTPERPLFGRHVGRFWIPPHTRGREERGKVEKDYQIV